MTIVADIAAPLKLPKIPVAVKDFISYFSNHPKTPAAELLEPYKNFEAELRKIYAQQPDHNAVKDGYTNMVPVYARHESRLTIRARSLATEFAEEKEKYIMPLDDTERKPNGAPAVVGSLKEFQHNFNLFSESSLTDMDWRNVVAAGSAVTTALLPVPDRWNDSKRSLREYYHEQLAPASDVDLFLYGLSKEEAIEKIKQIEKKIKDSILHETTTIRTKNAITIASQHPTRNVQIVLRLYDSVSQIITGFDVDCACAAYDGAQVYASPRALVAFATQTNTIDLTRRSPSYENRLSKYSHRGFEVHWPLLDRSRIDPTIFERSFSRTNGLARLLVLEKLPKNVDREAYMSQRRVERGRPPMNAKYRNQSKLWGNLKDQEEDDIAEWVEQDEVSNYHTMVVPYGPRFNAAKINKLLYTKDLLLNAEWNKSKDREVNLHRHPCFFGNVEDILGDCCMHCPVLPPSATDEELKIAEEESKIYISGSLTFIKDDPGRQEIGSFNPITTDDWCEMAFVGNTQMLCQAIIDGDINYVRSWCKQEGNDVNTRDYCGRTPLHLAIISTSSAGPVSGADNSRKRSLEIMQCLIDNDARMVARLLDGRTALHLAAAQGDVEIVKALMRRSLANEEEEAEKEEKRKAARKAEKREDGGIRAKVDGPNSSSAEELDSDEEIDNEDSDEDSVTVGSFIKVKSKKPENTNEIPEDTDEPDFFDINVVAWDVQTSPLHLAIINGHIKMIRLLVEEYGADVLLPIKLNSGSFNGNHAILTLVLALSLHVEKAKEVAKLLLELGATCSQGDINHFTSLHYIVSEDNSELLDMLFLYDGPAARAVLNIVAMGSSNCGTTAMTIALKKSHDSMVAKLRSLGAKSTISFDDFIKAYVSKNDYAKNQNADQSMNIYRTNCDQPLMIAAVTEKPKIMELLLDDGSDPSTLDTAAYRIIKDNYVGRWQCGKSVLDVVNDKLKALREFQEPNENKPENLKPQSFYTSGLKQGTYEHYMALHYYKDLKASNMKAHKDHEKKLIEAKEGKGIKEKRVVIKHLIIDLELIEKRLLKAGAKTFREMYPDVPKYEGNKYGYSYNLKKDEANASKPWAFTLLFGVSTLDDRQREGYQRLFEAAWAGDIEEVKYLTLGQWKCRADDTINIPLRVSATDDKGFSPFSIAVLRGHYKVGRAIVEISHAQYEPEDKSGYRERWTIDSYDSEDESGYESDRPNIYKEIINDTYTIENVAAISSTVKSRCTPLNMISAACPALWFADVNSLNDLELGNHSASISLMDYAVRTDDIKLLKYLLQLEAEQRLGTDEISASRIVTISLFDTAIRIGRTAMLAELIKATGVGIPLDDLVKKSGVVLKDKPKYYQGLNVGGKKRTDWAQAGTRNRYGNGTSSVLSDQTTPLLRAARCGNIESVQWFLSDAPARRYMEFAAANKSDNRVRALEQSPDGYEKTIKTWLDLRSELTLHCAVLWNPSYEKNVEYVALVKYLISVMPESLEHKSLTGLTPLHLAMAAQRPEIVELLLSAGANQRIRDAYGRNVIHMLVARLESDTTLKAGPDRLRSIISLLGKNHVKEMLLERCTTTPQDSALTPLALWLKKSIYIDENRNPDTIKVLMEYSGGEDLDIINGDGDLPLHQAVKHSVPSITYYLINVRPELLFRENATGRTPLEMATDLYLQDRVSNAPRVAEYFDRGSACHLVNRQASEFVPKEEAIDNNTVSKKRTYEVCVEAAKENPGKRRLVSLFEANEVAKRLAGQKKRIRGAKYSETVENVPWDEVTAWIGDLYKEHKKLWETNPTLYPSAHSFPGGSGRFPTP